MKTFLKGLAPTRKRAIEQLPTLIEDASVVRAKAAPRSVGWMHHAAAGVGAFVAMLSVLTPNSAFACACGCGIFDIGAISLLPTGTGGVAYLEYDYMDQNKNRSGTSSAPSENNSDKELRTHFFTAGLNYMWNHEWGIMVKVPYWDRSFTTDVGGGDIETFKTRSLGDIRVEGMYTGFSPDMSTGITFGLKFPTGDYTAPNFDRDTQIGTGSTDLLLGAYHIDTIDQNGDWNWFVQGHYQRAIATRAATDPASGLSLDYRPGDEINAAAGVSYNFGSVGPFSTLSLVGQFKGTHRDRDTGDAANNDNTGYSRVVFAPGISATIGSVRLFAEVGAPVYQNVNGNQITARTYFKLVAGISF